MEQGYSTIILQWNLSKLTLWDHKFLSNIGKLKYWIAQVPLYIIIIIKYHYA